MPKHKKTREQKMRADERRTSLQEQTVAPGPSYSYSFSQVKQTVGNASHTVLQHTDILVRNDLRKTAIVSVGILVLQLVLYFLLRNHVLAFSFVRY